MSVHKHDSIQVKKFLRTNDWLPSARIRAELWRELCRDTQRQGRITVYREIVADKVGVCWYLHKQHLQRGRFPAQEPASVRASSTVRCHHRLNEEGQRALMRVLGAVERVRPDFTNIPVRETFLGEMEPLSIADSLSVDGVSITLHE
jgi:hypothetical protein